MTTPGRPVGTTYINMDPYSWAMQRIVSAVEQGLEHGGAMSDEEGAILLKLREVIEAEDPTTWENIKRMKLVEGRSTWAG